MYACIVDYITSIKYSCCYVEPRSRAGPPLQPLRHVCPAVRPPLPLDQQLRGQPSEPNDYNDNNDDNSNTTSHNDNNNDSNMYN